MESKKVNIKNEEECKKFLDGFADKALDYLDEDLSLWDKKKPIDGVQIYRKKNKEGHSLKREEGTINMPRNEFMKNLLENTEFASNEMVKDKIKNKIHAGKFFHHWSITKSYPLFSAREIEFLLRSEEQPDGSILIVGTSIETQDLQKDSIRGESLIIGWILKEDDKDKNKTIAQNVSHFDLKGSVPEFVMNLIDNSFIAESNKHKK